MLQFCWINTYVLLYTECDIKSDGGGQAKTLENHKLELREKGQCKILPKIFVSERKRVRMEVDWGRQD